MRKVSYSTQPYFDKTSWRNKGKRHYAWIGTTKNVAYYRIDPHRSKEALFKMIGKFTNRPAVTDRYSAYNVLDGLALGSDVLSGLCERLIDDFERLWTFLSIEGMDPTNNMAERDLRKLVLWRKKSYGTRSKRGQKFVERITSVVETLKKNHKSPLKFLENALISFYQKKPSPLINPSLGF